MGAKTLTELMPPGKTTIGGVIEENRKLRSVNRDLVEACAIFSRATNSLLRTMPNTNPEEMFIWHHNSNVPGEAFGISVADLISLEKALAKAKGTP